MQNFPDYSHHNSTSEGYDSPGFEITTSRFHNDTTSMGVGVGGQGSRAPMGMLPGLISKSTLAILLLVNSVIIIFFVSLAGSILNVINITVFVRQGLKDPISITLLVLSVADLGSVVTLWFQSIFLTLHFFPETFKEFDPRYMMGFMSWPHSVFIRVSCLLTVFIAFERWICVTFPLQANRIITTRVAKIYNFVVMVSLVSTFISLYYYASVRKLFIPRENRTLYILTLSVEGIQYAFRMSSIVTSVYLATFGLLVIFTVLTIIKLNQQAKWRRSMASSSTGQADAATAKSQKVVKMVVVICLLFISTSIPSVVNTIIFMLVEGYIDLGRYHNLYTLVTQICFTLEVSNSTANFFIYLIMSSNYSTTFYALFGIKKDKNIKRAT